MLSIDIFSIFVGQNLIAMNLIKSFFFVSLIFVSATTFAQRARVTFDFAMTQSGSQLVPDSIFIENLAAGCDTTLYYPNNSLEVKMLSDIETEFAGQEKLRVEVWYVDASDNSVAISVYVPGTSVSMNVYDTNGRMCCNGNYQVSPGYNIFKLRGASQKSIVNFECDGDDVSVTVINVADSSRKCRIEYAGMSPRVFSKSMYATDNFIFHQGDEMRYTMFSNSCNQVISRQIIDNPIQSTEYSFDFTNVTSIRPDLITIYDSVCSMQSLAWTWQPVEGADGYKYNIVNDLESATDLGAATTVEYPTALDSSRNYKIFVWAYNECGVSDYNVLCAATPARPITDAEYAIATADTSVLRIMNIFIQPDSVILRTPSINVDVTDTIWNYLANRMYLAAKRNGVGIAAPQVGINRNVVCLQRWDKGGSSIFSSHPWEFYFNPQIIEYSDSVVRREDGCLSVPSGSSYPSIGGYSYRATWVVVTYYDVDGVFHKEKITQQYTAHIFQHELDHLNSVMFFDRQVQENAFKYTVIEGDSYEGLPEIR